MSAELLRKAAALMRSRADAAIVSLPDAVPDWHSVGSLMGDGKTRGDAEHIASWHPAVALAVADWLAAEAANFERNYAPDTHPGDYDSTLKRALTVARAYLGTDRAEAGAA